MSEFGKAVLTAAGFKLLNDAISGKSRLEFTRIALGDGAYTDEQKTPAALQTMTALRSEKQSYPITSKSAVSDKAVKLTALLTNWDQVTGEALVTEGFHQNEIGLFCKAIGDDASEVLYSVAVADDGTIMPAFNGKNPTQIRQSFVVSVDNTDNITVKISPGYIVDDKLDSESVNPVQNKVIMAEITALKAKDDEMGQNITALLTAVTLLKGSAINGTSGNVVVETFDDANSYVMVSGQYDKSNKRLYA